MTAKRVDYDQESDRLWQRVLDAHRRGCVGWWKVQIIQVTDACYNGADSVAYLHRALKWIELHPEGGL